MLAIPRPTRAQAQSAVDRFERKPPTNDLERSLLAFARKVLDGSEPSAEDEAAKK